MMMKMKILNCFLDDLDGDLEETPPPRDDAPRYLREAVEVCGADAALEGLTARERDVLEARYWSEAPRTQLDAANELGREPHTRQQFGKKREEEARETTGRKAVDGPDGC